MPASSRTLRAYAPVLARSGGSGATVANSPLRRALSLRFRSLMGLPEQWLGFAMSVTWRSTRGSFTMSRRAVVLAGGKGSRLRPYTVVLPKPLMPIGDYPILEVILRQLSRYGFDRVTLAVNHQADIVRAFCGDGSKWGISIDYSLETKPLSTIGPLKLLTDLPDNFLLMNGDVLTDLDIGILY